jgi:2-polyprenyl-3-methyl-5-hydroxy-6-metoxy-1,4-benzoquinol methylase
MQDHFHEKSKAWDQANIRVESAKKIADAINKKIELTKEMEILDFGVGTGLLGFEIATKVQKVYGIDTSLSMLEKLKAKNTKELSIETYHQDIIASPLEKSFDGLVSSMTLHHVENLKAFFQIINKNVKDNGFLAIADLQSEDGSFHSDNTGVFHFGFNKEKLCKIVLDAGFTQVDFQTIYTINKPHRDFDIFLLTAKK